jgi:hypothetical protein
VGGPNAPILYKVSLFTYHAYNTTANGNLYDFRNITVTMRRPGGGIGGYYRHGDTADYYDGVSRRQTFMHEDAKIISWMHRKGYKADYCTDFDIHADPSILQPYRLLVTAGHDEYWSDPERKHVEEFIGRGGNVAFFSGNTCWWRVDIVDNDTALTCKKAESQWFLPGGINNPENSLTGVSYRVGGGWWDGPRTDVFYTVCNAAHWVYEGTGLQDGDPLGKNTQLVGYEADGAEYKSNGNRVVPTGQDGTPQSFVILGVGVLGPGWSFEYAIPGQIRAATMGVYTKNGSTVYNAATTDWARVLASGDAMLDLVTRNVFDNVAPLGQLDAVVAVTGYDAPSDEYQHVIVATAAGDVSEIYWKPQGAGLPGPLRGLLANVAGRDIVGIAGYYAAGDGYQHVIVATVNAGAKVHQQAGVKMHH